MVLMLVNNFSLAREHYVSTEGFLDHIAVGSFSLPPLISTLNKFTDTISVFSGEAHGQSVCLFQTLDWRAGT